MKSLRLKLFGGFQACDATEQEIKIAGTKAALLLAYLTLKPEQARSREELIGLLWGDRGDSQARGSLRQALWSLAEPMSLARCRVCSSALSTTAVVSGTRPKSDPAIADFAAADGPVMGW